jgi:hypothetical protein
MDRLAQAAINADPGQLAATKVAAEKAPEPAGIAPELLERCLKRKARPKKGVDAPKSADDLVILDQETKRLREQCVRTVIAQHRKTQAAPKK